MLFNRIYLTKNPDFPGGGPRTFQGRLSPALKYTRVHHCITWLRPMTYWMCLRILSKKIPVEQRYFQKIKYWKKRKIGDSPPSAAPCRFYRVSRTNRSFESRTSCRNRRRRTTGLRLRDSEYSSTPCRTPFEPSNEIKKQNQI